MCTTIRSVVINSQTVAGRTSLIRPPHIGYQNNAAFFTTHKAQQLTILIPSPCRCPIVRYLDYSCKIFSSSWDLLMRRTIRQMLSVSANQVPGLAIKSPQVASAWNELLATTEFPESFFPPLSQNPPLEMESDSCWIERSLKILTPLFSPFLCILSPQHYHVANKDGKTLKDAIPNMDPWIHRGRVSW